MFGKSLHNFENFDHIRGSSSSLREPNPLIR